MGATWGSFGDVAGTRGGYTSRDLTGTFQSWGHGRLALCAAGCKRRWMCPGTGRVARRGHALGCASWLEAPEDGWGTNWGHGRLALCAAGCMSRWMCPGTGYVASGGHVVGRASWLEVPEDGWGTLFCLCVFLGLAGPEDGGGQSPVGGQKLVAGCVRRRAGRVRGQCGGPVSGALR